MKHLFSAVIFGVSSLLIASSAHAETWKLVYEQDKNGQAISGAKADLVAAIRDGKSIRVYWASGRVEHLADATFLTIFGDEVFVQTPTIRGQRPSRPDDPVSITLNDGEWTGLFSTAEDNPFEMKWFVAE